MKLLLTILCFGFTISLFAQDTKDDIDQTIRISIDRGDDEERESMLVEENMSQKMSAYDHEKMSSFFDHKQYEAAQAYISKFIQPASDDAQAHNWAALTYEAMQLYPQAIAHINTAIQLSPYDAFLYNNRARFNSILGKDKPALADYQEAIYFVRSMPVKAIHSMTMYLGKGIVYFNIQQYDNALILFEHAKTLDPKSPYPYMWIGDVYLAQDSIPSAIDSYNLGLDLNPDLADLQYRKGIALYQMRKTKEASVFLEKAIVLYSESLRINPYAYEYLLNRAKAYTCLKKNKLALLDYKLALGKYDQLVAQNPQSPAMLYNRAIAHKGLKQYDEALIDLQQVLHLRPLYVEAQTKLAEIKRLIAKDED